MKDNSKRKKRKKIRNRKLLFVLILVVTIVVVIFAIKNKTENRTENKAESLIGNWTIDGTTNYEFDDKGNGKLKVPTKEYKFTYIIDNNKIHLDFEDDKATDSDFEYTFEDGNLILKGLNTYIGEYKLTKQN